MRLGPLAQLSEPQTLRGNGFTLVGMLRCFGAPFHVEAPCCRGPLQCTLLTDRRHPLQPGAVDPKQMWVTRRRCKLLVLVPDGPCVRF